MLKIIVSENNTFIKNSLISFFEDKDIHMEFCDKDGYTLLEHIKSVSPDVVICDVFMKKLDAIEMIEKAKALDNPPRIFFVTSSCDNENLINDIINSGFDYYFVKPYSVESLYNRILSMINTAKAIVVDSIDMKINNLLHQLEIPSHVKGFTYIKQAVHITLKQPEIINSVTKQLYPYIAEINNTTAARVERSIRTAIELCWGRADDSVLRKYFGFHVNNYSRPTNSEFIALLSDCIKYDFKGTIIC